MARTAAVQRLDLGSRTGRRRRFDRRQFGAWDPALAGLVRLKADPTLRDESLRPPSGDRVEAPARWGCSVTGPARLCRISKRSGRCRSAARENPSRHYELTKICLSTPKMPGTKHGWDQG